MQATRAKRYDLLRTARSVLLTSNAAQDLEHAPEIHRTCKCSWLTRAPMVGVHKSIEYERAFYSQLVTCGSVWTCPVCAAKVQERRRVEIETGVQWAYANKLQTAMLTFTAPHTKNQKLLDLLLMFRESLAYLRKGGPWERIKEISGYEALIRSLEVTHGVHGWHVHTHELWFMDQGADIALLKEKVIAKWLSSCTQSGLVNPKNRRQVKAFLEHSVDIQPFASCSKYLAKVDDAANWDNEKIRHWGIDRELAKSSTKVGRASGLHPFGLLELAGRFDGERSAKAAELFREFAFSMKETRSRQIYWSPKLKAKVGLKEKTDEQLAEETEDTAIELGGIPREDWKLVREYGLRAEVLNLAETQGWPAVQAMLDALVERAVKEMQEHFDALNNYEREQLDALKNSHWSRAPSAQAPPHGGAGARGAPPS